MEFTKTIETERLILRKCTLDDVNDIFDYMRREKVAKYLSWKPHKSIAETKDFLNNIVLPNYEEESYRWYIELKEESKIIGHIRVTSFNKAKKFADLGWAISDDYWGKGIMPEAGRAVLEYLKEIGFVRIEARHKVENINSGKVMQKIGMKFEGVLRKSGLCNNGDLVDSAVYSYIKDQD